MYPLNNFWSNLKSFAENTALIDTAKIRSIKYIELNYESDLIAEKIKSNKKGFVFLFTTNNSESLISYSLL
jgi:hypothetical protein